MKSCRGLGRDYWLFWFASSLGMGASNILQYVLSLYVLDLTGSATLFASMLSIIIFPRILLTPLAGVMADRVRKSRLMALILLGEAAVLGACFLIGRTVTIGIALVYLLVVVLEAGEIFYGGCEAAILPELVPSERLKDAISVSKVDDGIVQVAAPPGRRMRRPPRKRQPEIAEKRSPAIQHGKGGARYAPYADDTARFFEQRAAKGRIPEAYGAARPGSVREIRPRRFWRRRQNREHASGDVTGHIVADKILNNSGARRQPGRFRLPARRLRRIAWRAYERGDFCGLHGKASHDR